MSDENPYAPPQTTVTPLSGDDETVEELNPWTAIWLRPKATIRFILATDPGRAVLALAAISGVAQTLDRAVMKSLGDQLEMPIIFAIAFFVGPLSGIFGLYISGAFLRWTGSMLKGTAESQDVRAAIAWSSVPVVWFLPMWIPQLLLFGKELFTTETPRMDSDPMLFSALIGIGTVETVIGVWSFVVLLHTLGQAHGFSAWKALGSILIAILIIAVPLTLLVIGLAAAV
tara:strand:+ start:150 stop:836 length:687 start_codon:yes stop_codon:yes gene_type:complete